MENIKTLKMGQEKKCNNKCPQCGVKNNDDNIVIGSFTFDQFPFQEFECLKCGCFFEEVYKYSTSVKTGQRK
jgi:hypothetical protein